MSFLKYFAARGSPSGKGGGGCHENRANGYTLFPSIPKRDQSIVCEHKGNRYLHFEIGDAVTINNAGRLLPLHRRLF